MGVVTEMARWRYAIGILAVLGGMIWSDASARAEERGFLGMQVQGISPKIAAALALDQAIGVLVRDVSVAGPAADAGIRRGDLIVKVQGTDIDTFERLLRVVGTLGPGDKVSIDVLRAGARKTVEMTLASWPDGWQIDQAAVAVQPELGLTFAAMTPDLRSRLGIRWGSTGIVVTVADNAFATVSALQRGDIVVQINQQPVWQPTQFLDAYAKAKADSRPSMLLLIERSDGFKYVLQPIVTDAAAPPPVFKLPGQGG